MSDDALHPETPRGGQKFERLIFIASPCAGVPGKPEAFLSCLHNQGVAVVAYVPETATVGELVDRARRMTEGRPVRSIGIMAPTIAKNKDGDGRAIWICGEKNEGNLEVGGVLSALSIKGNNPEINTFVDALAELVVPYGRIHILSERLMPTAKDMVQALRDRTKVSVAAGRGPTWESGFVLVAEEVDDSVSVGRIYFNLARLDKWKANPDQMPERIDMPKNEALKAKAKDAFSNADNMERLQTIFTMLPFLYSVMVASFLAIFVPQLCPDPAPAHSCSFHENVTGLTKYNTLVLAVNVVTCAMLLIGQSYYGARELWMIQFLDSNPTEPYDALRIQSFNTQFPQLARKLRTHNRQCTIVSIVSLAVLIINFVLSAVLVLKFYYDGPRTISTLISSTLLVVLQVKNAVSYCYVSWKKELGISTKSFIPKSFNTVDKDYDELRQDAGNDDQA